MNESGNHVFNGGGLSGRRVRITVLVCSGLVGGYAKADAIPPPSSPPAVNQSVNTSFPSGQKLTQMGYNSQNGTLTVNNNGKATVTVNGDKITGTQGKTITATGKYGETGKINTTVNQQVGTSALTKAAAAAYGATALGGALNSPYMNAAISDIKKGDYWDAAKNGLGATLEGLSALDITGVGRGVGNVLGEIFPDSAWGKGADSGGSGGSNGATTGAELGVNGTPQGQALGEAAAAARGAQSAAMSRGDFAGAAAAAAAAKGATAAATAANINGTIDQAPKDEQGRRLYPAVFTFIEHPYDGSPNIVTQQYGTSPYPGYRSGNNISRRGGDATTYQVGGGMVSSVIYNVQKPDTSRIVQWKVEVRSEKVDVKKEDLTLSESEVEDILKQMLANQNANHEALMNQLAGMAAAGGTTINSTTNNNTVNNAPGGGSSTTSAGGQSVVDAATTSHTNTGGSSLSEPYTPAGSNQAQQTHWQLNQDGSITATTIPRPDLQPHSSAAPTKAENTTTGQNATGQNPAATGQTPSQQQQQEQQKTACEATPNAAMCQELGEENGDIELGERTIDLAFSPLDIFDTDGQCPAPRVVALGAFGRFEFSYEPMCDFARMLRPVMILGAMIMTAFFVWEAVGNQS